MKNATYRDMAGANGLLANRAWFKGNSLWAEHCTSTPHRGQLDNDEAQRLYDDFAAANNHDMYVVYSYTTPIAWGRRNGEIYCTPQRFSVTTSKGQNYVRAWVNNRKGE